MRLYVWEGKNVLENYGTGLVVVPAENLTDAWDKLKKHSPEVWFRLVFGKHMWSYIETLDEAIRGLSKEEIEECASQGFPVYPTEYEIGALPIIVFEGTE